MAKSYSSNGFQQACFSPGGRAAAELKKFLEARG
jgi:hypothetical protein